MHKLAILTVFLMFVAAACVSQPDKPWDKEGVRQHAGETGKKLEREEKR